MALCFQLEEMRLVTMLTKKTQIIVLQTVVSQGVEMDMFLLLNSMALKNVMMPTQTISTTVKITARRMFAVMVLEKFQEQILKDVMTVMM